MYKVFALVFIGISAFSYSCKWLHCLLRFSLPDLLDLMNARNTYIYW